MLRKRLSILGYEYLLAWMEGWLATHKIREEKSGNLLWKVKVKIWCSGASKSRGNDEGDFLEMDRNAFTEEWQARLNQGKIKEREKPFWRRKVQSPWSLIANEIIQLLMDTIYAQRSFIAYSSVFHSMLNTHTSFIVCKMKIHANQMRLNWSPAWFAVRESNGLN